MEFYGKFVLRVNVLACLVGNVHMKYDIQGFVRTLGSGMYKSLTDDVHCE